MSDGTNWPQQHEVCHNHGIATWQCVWHPSHTWWWGFGAPGINLLLPDPIFQSEHIGKKYYLVTEFVVVQMCVENGKPDSTSSCNQYHSAPQEEFRKRSGCPCKIICPAVPCVKAKHGWDRLARVSGCCSTRRLSQAKMANNCATQLV